MRRPTPSDIRHVAEIVVAICALAVFRVLPLDTASGFGGWLGRTIGPRLRASNRARRNLQLAMPELAADAHERIVRDMWDNLGRVLAEYPNLPRVIAGNRVEVVGGEHLKALAADPKGGIMFSAHFANWELFALGLMQIGVEYAQIYRAPNNPFAELLVRWLRRLPPELSIPKGPQGARQALTVLKEGKLIGMLVDQKMNDGISVPFFGVPAMTPPALAQLALRFGCNIVPVKMERLGGCRFRITAYPALDLPKTADRQADILAAMTEVNALIEGFIRERPEQWLWLHRRWPDGARREE